MVIVLFCDPTVEVAVATTSDTVIVFVKVAVDVRVVVEELAMARRGNRRVAVRVGRCILPRGRMDVLVCVWYSEGR